MKTLRDLQLYTEKQYGSEAKTFFLDEVGEEGFESVSVAKAVYSMLLTQKGDILIQNAISFLIRGMGVKPSPDAVADALSIIESAAFTNLADVHCVEGGHAYIRSKIRLSDEAYERYNTAMYLPPMVVPPLDWTEHADGGYINERLPAILKWKNRHNGFLNYDALNAAQQTQYTLDGFIMTRFNDPVCPADRQQYEEIATYALLLARPFHFVWQYDSRGRMYSHGYHMDIQSREYKKCLINFAKTESLTEEGKQEMFYALAEAAGQRKPKYSDQVLAGQHLYDLFEPAYIADGSVDLTQEFFETTGVKERITFTKLLKALLEHYVDGVETGAMVSRDATASGLQIMAALSGCPITSNLTNLTSEKRECAYAAVIDRMNQNLDPEDHIDRKVGKQCLMTHYYCSVATPQKLLTPVQLDEFYAVIATMFEGPELVMREIVEAWTDRDTFTWRLPDGHVANVKVWDKEAAEIEWHGSVFTYEYTTHKANNNYRHLAANVVQSLDAYIARRMQLMAKDQGFDMASIHDCYNTHGNHSRKALANYREIMQEIADNNYLQDILQQLRGDPTYTFTKVKEGLQVTSEYCICS